jgi:hypothetical protein
MSDTTREIREAVARGWCHPANEHKVMDVDLAEAIIAEVEKALGCRVSAASVTGDVTAAPPPDPGPCSCDCHSCDDLPLAVVMTAGGPRCRGCLPNGIVNPSFGPPPTDDEIRAIVAGKETAMSDARQVCEACGGELTYYGPGPVAHVLPPTLCHECAWAGIVWAARMARAGLVSDLGESYPAFYGPNPPATTDAVFGPPPVPESITLPMTPDRVMSLEAGTDVVFDDGPITITLRPTPPDAVAGPT